MAVLAHFQDDRLDALAGVVRFTGDLFAARQKGLGLAHRDDGGPPLEALDGAEDEIALLGEVLAEDGVALFLADALDDELLGRLGGDAAEFIGREHLLAFAHRDGAAGAIDNDLDAFLVLELLVDGQAHCLLDVEEDHLLVHSLFAVEKVHRPQQIRAVHGVIPSSFSRELLRALAEARG